MQVFEIFSKFAFAVQIELTANDRTIEKFNKSFVLKRAKNDFSLVAQNAVATKLFFLKSGKATFVKSRDSAEVLITTIENEMVPLGISGFYERSKTSACSISEVLWCTLGSERETSRTW